MLDEWSNAGVSYETPYGKAEGKLKKVKIFLALYITMLYCWFLNLQTALAKTLRNMNGGILMTEKEYTKQAKQAALEHGADLVGVV